MVHVAEVDQSGHQAALGEHVDERDIGVLHPAGQGTGGGQRWFDPDREREQAGIGG